jgi:hypothetical protein
VEHPPSAGRYSIHIEHFETEATNELEQGQQTLKPWLGIAIMEDNEMESSHSDDDDEEEKEEEECSADCSFGSLEGTMHSFPTPKYASLDAFPVELRGKGHSGRKNSEVVLLGNDCLRLRVLEYFLDQDARSSMYMVEFPGIRDNLEDPILGLHQKILQKERTMAKQARVLTKEQAQLYQGIFDLTKEKKEVEQDNQAEDRYAREVSPKDSMANQFLERSGYSPT